MRGPCVVRAWSRRRLSEDMDHVTCPRMVQMAAVRRYGPRHLPSSGPGGGCQKMWTTSPSLEWSRWRLSVDMDHVICPRVVHVATVRGSGPFHLPSNGPDDGCQKIWTMSPTLAWSRWRLLEDLDHVTCPRMVQMAAVRIIEALTL